MKEYYRTPSYILFLTIISRTFPHLCFALDLQEFSKILNLAFLCSDGCCLRPLTKLKVYLCCVGARSVPSHTCILWSEWLDSDGKCSGYWEWHSHEAGVTSTCNSQCYWNTRQQHETDRQPAPANSHTSCCINLQQQPAAVAVQFHCLQWDYNQW